MYILTNSYTAVILICTHQAIFVIDNGSEYIFRLMPTILIPLPDIHVSNILPVIHTNRLHEIYLLLNAWNWLEYQFTKFRLAS